MSLEKFQATEVWRNKFKTHLFTERKAPFVAGIAATSKTPQRLSYQISEDLQVILEEKKIPRPDKEMPRVRDADVEDDKENIEEFHERLHASTITPRKLTRQQNIDNTVIDEDVSDALHVTNTSFETLENMCEKTASDPNSTLFKYLSESPQKMHNPRPNRVPTYDEEADALQRLLNELDIEESEKSMRGIPSMADVTQLEDIEAPSRFWENTMLPENLQSISPVKMVGLMRQSTIMEEYSDISESEVSSTSYQSAMMKTGFSSETTGCYETASDTAACSDRGGALKKLSTNSSERSSSSELFQVRNSRQKFFSDEKSEEKEEPEQENTERSIQLMDFSLQKEEDPLGQSLQLIDLDTTVKSPQDQESEEEKEEEDPLSNSPESPKSPQEEVNIEPEISMDSLKSTLGVSAPLIPCDESESLIIELSDDDSPLPSSNKDYSQSPLNRSFTIKSEEKPQPQENEEKSLHFNDTMEEVEYMMNKGMQYLQAVNHPQQDQQLSNTPPNNKKSHLTPVKKFDRYRSPSPMLSSATQSPHTPKTVIVRPKPVNKQHVLDIKPFPKLDLFKKPSGANLKPANKFTSSVKKQQYAHVVSPIGAYIKKTPTTPLISTARPEVPGVSSSPSSKALRKLDCDSRVGASPRPLQSQNPVRSLPKKAYISSDLKHIVDERTQYTIPGGPKIQRYLVSAMIPAVVRHDGKVKIPPNLRTDDMQPPAPPKRVDDSLGDLSMVSGDVSLYTIKDAQKF